MSERCEAIFPDLSAMLDNEVDDDVRASVDVHLAECAECRGRLEKLTSLRAGLRDLIDDEPPPGFAEQARAHVLAQPKRTSPGCGLGMLLAILGMVWLFLH